MCLNTKSIYNRTHSFTPGISKLNVTVPCGKCDECVQSKKNEWFLRCYAEYEDIKKIGGSCFFLTLTYADEFLPRFRCEYNSKTGRKTLDTACFSYDDIHTFINCLRKKLTRTFGSSMKLRYIVFPEYGSNTKRPHYHCLFWTTLFMSDKSFFSMVDGYDNDVFRRRFYSWSQNLPYFKTREKPNGIYSRGAWHKGFVLVSSKEKGGMVVSSERSILYCSKYASKDISFYGKDDIKDFLDSVSDKSICQDNTMDYYFSQIRPFLPRHYQSPSLGFNWLYYKFIRDYNKYIRDGFSVQIGPKDSVSYNLPQYYKRKILYRYDVTTDDSGKKVVRWYYNSNVRDIHLAYLDYNMNKSMQSLYVYRTYDFRKSFSMSDLYNLGFYSFDSLHDYLHDIFNKYTPFQISIFRLVFKDRSNFVDALGIEHPTMSDFISRYKEYYLRFIDNSDLLDVGYAELSEHKYEFNYSYNNSLVFDGLSDFCELLSELDNHLRISEYKYRNFINDIKDTFTPVQDHFTPLEI